jgi:TolB protein
MRGTACLVAGAIAVGCSGSDEGKDSGQPAAPPSSSEIPLAKSGYSNIYVTDTAGRSVDRLTKGDDVFARDPSWSASGGIAFSQAPPSEFARLFVLQADGSARREVPTRATHLFHPTWSADARQIAVVRLGKGIYLVDPRTGSGRPLRNTGEFDNAPVWSPDGRSIVFERQLEPTNWDLFRVKPTGKGLRRLTRDPLQQVNAAWSPDGSTLVFAEQQRTGNWALVRMKLDGSQRQRLTDPSISTQEPAWSPDGKKIACVLQEGDRTSIAVVSATGGDPVRITPRSLVPSHPVWSPDGKKIAFAAQSVVRPPPTASPGAQG